MPVQAIPVKPPPIAEPSFIDGLFGFVQNYWGLLLFFLGCGIALLFFYFWRKDRKDEAKTKYHKLLDKVEELCRNQANKNRLQSNPSLLDGIIGLGSVIIWFVSLLFFGIEGVFIGLMIGFTAFIGGGLLSYFINPFVKRDMVFIRYKQNNMIQEKYVGDYAGEYYGSDGYLNLFVFKGRKKIIFRNKLVIRIPQSIDAFYDLEQLEKDYVKDKEGMKKELKKIEEKYSSFIPEIIQFNERTIVINHAKSLDRFQHFYYPVFVDELGHVISKGVRYYKSIKEQVALEQLYDMTEEASKAAIRTIQINPSVQFKQATGDDAIDDVDVDDDK